MVNSRLPEVLRIAVQVITEWLIYGLPGVVFLAIYVGKYSALQAAVSAHLYLVILSIFFISGLRLIFSWGGQMRRTVNLVLVIAVTGWLSCVLAFYILVIVGLASWGRVPTWDLVAVYAIQCKYLITSLGFTSYAVIALAAIIVLVLGILVWGCFSVLRWPDMLTRLLPKTIRVALIALFVLGPVSNLYLFYYNPLDESEEPVSLAFFTAPTVDVQSHEFESHIALELNRFDEVARKSNSDTSNIDRRNVILIIADALRADRLSVNGYSRETTPNLDRLVAAGKLRLSQDMRSVCSESACGLLGIASSRYVHQLSLRALTLQELLRMHGYTVHLLLSGDHTSFYGLRDTYGEVDHYYDGTMAKERLGLDLYVNDDSQILHYLTSYPEWDGKPVMMQFHLMSAHALGVRESRYEKFKPAANYSVPIRRYSDTAGNYYDNGVLQLDAVIERLLSVLQGKGYLDDALVVITADHGEGLGEHGLYSHAKGVYETVLRVPFLLFDFAPENVVLMRSRRIVSQVDVAPTILFELGIQAPQSWRGVALQDSFARDWIQFQQGQEVGLIDLRGVDGPWKYWIDKRTGQEYAFDLGSDSGEMYNLIQQVDETLRQDWRDMIFEMVSAVN